MVQVLSPSPDETAQRVALDAVAGRMSTQAARHLLAELALASPIPAKVAAQAGARGQRLVDAAVSLRERVIRQILDADSGDFFDLTRFVQASFEAWLRNTAAAFALRDPVLRPRGMAGRMKLVGDLEDPSEPVRARAERGWLDVATGSAEEVALEALAAGRESELVDIARRVHGQRDGTLRFAAASAIRSALGLPGLCVPSSRDDRDFVLAACAADPLVADRSRRSTIESLREGGRPSLTDERLLALWDDMTVEQMERLDPYPPAATHVLVVGALERMPKAPRAVVRLMRGALREAGDERSASWSALTQRLLESWLARSCRPVSDFDGTSDAASKAAKRASAERAAGDWPAVLAETCAWPGAPLGTCGEEVERQMGAMFLRALDEADSHQTR